MFNLRSISPLLAIAALAFSSVAQEPPADASTTNATVVSVISAGTLRVQSNASEEMVVLYGVLAPVSISVLGTEAKEQLETLLQGKSLRLEERDNLGGVPGVVAYLDDGECLNEFLVASGLALWDRATAPDYVQLMNAQESAKRNHAGIWKGMGDSEKPAEIDTSARLEEFKKTSKLRRQAFFDAAYEKWITLSDQQQIDIFNSVNDAQLHVENVGDARISNLEDSASEYETAAQAKDSEVDASRNRMVELQQQRNRDLNAINADQRTQAPPFQAGAGIRFYTQDAYSSNVGVVFGSQVDNVHMVSNYDALQANVIAAETDARYQAAMRAEATSAVGAAREREALEANAQAVRNRQEQTTSLQNQLTIDAETTRSFLLQLREAQNAGYTPVSKSTELTRADNTSTTNSVNVTITSSVWRLDCDTPAGTDGSGLTVDLYQGDSPTPFRRLAADAPLFRRFLVLDESGTFRLEIQNPKNARFTVTVYEISAP